MFSLLTHMNYSILQGLKGAHLEKALRIYDIRGEDGQPKKEQAPRFGGYEIDIMASYNVKEKPGIYNINYHVGLWNGGVGSEFCIYASGQMGGKSLPGVAHEEKILIPNPDIILDNGWEFSLSKFCDRFAKVDFSERHGRESLQVFTRSASLSPERRREIFNELKAQPIRFWPTPD